eukprot:13557189-Alexandrium_andersonii.AAC.1
MGGARETVLDDQEVSVAVDPLHPVLLGGHKVARQVRPHAGGLICVRPLVARELRDLTHSTSVAVGVLRPVRQQMMHGTGFRAEIALLGPGEVGNRSGRSLGRNSALSLLVRSLAPRVAIFVRGIT